MYAIAHSNHFYLSRLPVHKWTVQSTTLFSLNRTLTGAIYNYVRLRWKYRESKWAKNIKILKTSVDELRMFIQYSAEVESDLIEFSQPYDVECKIEEIVSVYNQTGKYIFQ